MLLLIGFYRAQADADRVSKIHAAALRPEPNLQEIRSGGIMSTPKVVNCTFAFLCTRIWDDLALTEGVEKVRYCVDCNKGVYICTVENFQEHALAGHCVALVSADDQEPSGRRALVGLIRSEVAEER